MLALAAARHSGLMTHRPPTSARRRLSPALVTLLGVALLIGGCALTVAGSPGTGELSPAAAAALTDQDGYIPDGERLPVDDTRPAVARLTAPLRAALLAADHDARRDGLTLMVNNGWRSPAYQQALFDQAIVKYGSAAEAARWVATPQTSHHVQGAAVDIGPVPAARWLGEHGAAYGLCRTYANEPWHFELATGGSCPRPLADAAAG